MRRERAVRKIVTVALLSYSIGVQLCLPRDRRYFLLDPPRESLEAVPWLARPDHHLGVEFMRRYCASYLARKRAGHMAWLRASYLYRFQFYGRFSHKQLSANWSYFLLLSVRDTLNG